MPQKTAKADGTKTLKIEVFRSGTFTPMQGKSISYSSDDLEKIAASYDAENAPAPIVVGHPQTDTPAFGWVDGFEYDADLDRLFANATLNSEFATAVGDGHYKKVSMSFYMPEADNNPNPGAWYPKHLGFLGGAAPAVSGLKPIGFSNNEGTTTFVAAFGEAGFEETATLFRMMRDFMIEKFGLEQADNVLPAYRLDWLSDTEIRLPDAQDPTKHSSYTEPTMPKTAPKTDANTATREQDLDAREAAFAEREAAFAAREAEARSASNASFAERMVTEGRVLPANKSLLLDVLNAVPAGQEVAFSEGDNKGKTQDLGQALQVLIQAQPAAVSFGAQDLGDDPSGGDSATASFACDGKVFDQDQVGLDQKARAFMAQNPGVEYIAAVQAVS